MSCPTTNCRISETLDRLKRELYVSNDGTSNIKYFLADIFLQIKQDISHTYGDLELPFSHNAAILELIESKHYLYEILLYFTEQFDTIIRGIGGNASESIFDDILDYISRNYSEPLKLETIAPLFGYNSSYLDQLRVRKATELLDQTDMKVYEIAARVGYKNVDYFHQKFRKIMDISPAEYRKK